MLRVHMTRVNRDFVHEAYSNNKWTVVFMDEIVSSYSHTKHQVNSK